MKTVLDVQPKAHMWQGKLSQPVNTQGTYNADISKNQIRIYGVMTNHIHGPQRFDKTFKIGDEVEHGSYNLRYTGKIISIGEKTVTIERSDLMKSAARLSLYEFINRNWDFDAVKVHEENAKEMMCL